MCEVMFIHFRLSWESGAQNLFDMAVLFSRNSFRLIPPMTRNALPAFTILIPKLPNGDLFYPKSLTPIPLIWSYRLKIKINP